MPSVSWSQLIPKPTSKFLLVMCHHCGNKQVVFNHAKVVVKCSVCSEVIAQPKGGKAKILGRIEQELE